MVKLKKLILQPKKFKFKKVRKGRLKKYIYNSKINFGFIGLKAVESCFITSKQIESARQAISRKIKKKGGKIWIKIFPKTPITKKPNEVRMGKGKGNLSHWAAKVRGGSIIFEIGGVKKNIAIRAFKTGGAKLPVKTKICN